jgi:hypothetical protein
MSDEKNARIDCPFCKEGTVYTKWVRKSKKTGTIKRSKNCKSCGETFYTVEMLGIDYNAIEKVTENLIKIGKAFDSAMPSLEYLRTFYETIRAKRDKKKKQ